MEKSITDARNGTRSREGHSSPQPRSDTASLGQMLLSVLQSHTELDAENAELRQKLRKVEEERARLVEELAERTQTSERLARVLAHDLRNPIGAILAGADLLIRRGAVTELQGNILGRIHSSGERAARMVEDLLDFTHARLGWGLKIHRAPTDMAKIAREVVDAAEQANPMRSIRLEIEGDASGDWDEDRIAQALGNLLDNALAHSPEGSELTVSIRARDDGQVVSSVHNWGPAIEPDAFARLFEPFGRSEKKPERKTASLGLSLYIVQQVIAAHGGRVEAQSSEKEGTTFTVHLPRADESSTAVNDE